MGTYSNISLGVFIEVEMKEVPKIETTGHECENHHKTQKKDMFCTKCGAPAGIPVKTEVTERQNLYDLIYEDEELSLDEDTFWIANIDDQKKEVLLDNKRNSPYRISVEDEPYGTFEVTVVTSLIDDFKEEFAAQLQDLQNMCKSVEVKYGLVTHYS